MTSLTTSTLLDEPGLLVEANIDTFTILNGSAVTIGPINVTSSPDGSNHDLRGHAELEDLEYHLKVTRFVVQRCLVPLVVSFGVIGNIMNIAVLTRRWMRSSTNIYLTALAIFDILYLVFSLFMSFKHYDTIRGTHWYTHFAKPYGKPLIDTWSNTAVWLTVTLTVERYIGICMPMKGKVLCTPERARTIVIIVCLITAFITCPEFFESRAVYSTKDNKTTLTVESTAFGDHPAYQWGYNYTNQALYTFLPLILLTVVNSLLIRTVMISARTRKHMTKVAVVKNDKQERHHSEQQKITIMLIAIVAVFLCCQLPQAILNLYFTYLFVSDNITARKMKIVTILANIFNLLVMLNSTTNFILYSSFSIKFRRTFSRLFCSCMERRRQQSLNAKANRELYSETGFATDGCKTTLIIQHTNSGSQNHANGRRNAPYHSANSYTPGKNRSQNIDGSGGGAVPNTVHVAYNPRKYVDNHAQRLLPLRSKNGYQEVAQNSNDPHDTFISAV